MSRRQEPDLASVNLNELLNGSSVVFLVFTEERRETFFTMLEELGAKTDIHKLRHVYFPPGILWNGGACHAVWIPKVQLDQAVLGRLLRQYFGFECPTGDFFTLGVTDEDDEAFDRVGLFGKK
jgi:hypothetical protein